MTQRYKYTIKGVVQGVGFRPFVYRLALSHNLVGYVLNNSSSVVVDIQGNTKDLADFELKLTTTNPPLSRIDDISKIKLTICEYKIFEIKISIDDVKSTLLSPDMAICDECLKELSNPQNRRYNYYFINCTNCGVRYTIINDLPYDRQNTSMKKFVMCDECESEYNNPLDRRYHAQPISCHKCTPKLMLKDNKQNILSTANDAIKECANLIKDGKIVAIKGVGGYHIVCDSTNTNTILLLRERKKRPKKPFAIMCKDISMVDEYAHTNKYQKSTLSSIQKPIVLLTSKNNPKISNQIAIDISKIGIFLPYTPLHHILLSHLSYPIVATSANISDEPIIQNENDLIQKLGNVIDYYLEYDRDIINGCDDSVVMTINDTTTQTLRLARGYAPYSFATNIETKKTILAFGANQKSTIAFNINNTIILSPHIGNLGTISSLEYFKATIETFAKIYQLDIDIIVCDKHPTYESTTLAQEYQSILNIPLIQLQHHYTHTLAIMAEYSLDCSVLAFVFDGTGYGDDGTIWGGEVLLANTTSYDRVYHLRDISLLGGEKAIKEPRRVALAMLFEHFSLDEVLSLDTPTTKSFSPNEIKLLHKMWQNKTNSPLTSSMARVFDIVASLSDILQYSDYEGDCGMMIEEYYDSNITDTFYYTIIDGVIEIDFLRDFVQDKYILCTKLINTIASIILDISKRYNLPIVLAGGVFQNKTLLNKTINLLQQNSIKYYIPKTLPLNDGSISVGQLYWCMKNITQT